MRILRWLGELWTRVSTVASVPERMAAAPAWFAECGAPPAMFEIEIQFSWPPCGECHLRSGETCDICRRTATLTGLPARHIGELC